MKYTKIDKPLANIQQVKINGELIVIPSTYDYIRIIGNSYELSIYLCSYDHYYHWLLAEIEIEEVDELNEAEFSIIRHERDIYDGYDIDAAIKYILDQCKID